MTGRRSPGPPGPSPCRGLSFPAFRWHLPAQTGPQNFRAGFLVSPLIRPWKTEAQRRRICPRPHCQCGAGLSQHLLRLSHVTQVVTHEAASEPLITCWFSWHSRPRPLPFSSNYSGRIVLTASWQALPAAALVNGECQLQFSRYQAPAPDGRSGSRRTQVCWGGRVYKEGLCRVGRVDSGTLGDPSHTLQNLLPAERPLPPPLRKGHVTVQQGCMLAQAREARFKLAQTPGANASEPESPTPYRGAVTVLRASVPRRIGTWLRHLVTAIQLLYRPIEWGLSASSAKWDSHRFVRGFHTVPG